MSSGAALTNPLTLKWNGGTVDRVVAEKKYLMTIVKHFFLCVLIISILSLNGGCATLPNVSEKIDEAPTAQRHRQIVSSKGLLSPEKSLSLIHISEPTRPY